MVITLPQFETTRTLYSSYHHLINPQDTMVGRVNHNFNRVSDLTIQGYSLTSSVWAVLVNLKIGEVDRQREDTTVTSCTRALFL